MKAILLVRLSEAFGYRSLLLGLWVLMKLAIWFRWRTRKAVLWGGGGRLCSSWCSASECDKKRGNIRRRIRRNCTDSSFSRVEESSTAYWGKEITDSVVHAIHLTWFSKSNKPFVIRRDRLASNDWSEIVQPRRFRRCRKPIVFARCFHFIAQSQTFYLLINDHIKSKRIIRTFW